MTAAVNSPEDVINLALRRIGYAKRIGSIYDGSKASRAALDVYAQTRDDLLRTRDYGFARRAVDATLYKQAPIGGYIPGITSWNPVVNPPTPWLFSYLYPTDCLRVRSTQPVPIFVQNFDAQPYVFGIYNDNSTPPAVKTILCNIAPSMVLTYSAQVTNPAEWDADFTEVLIAALGKGLAPILVQNGMEVAKLAMQAEDKADQESGSVQG